MRSVVPMALFTASVVFLVARPAAAVCERPGDPDCVDFFTDFRGTIDFFATGASFTVDVDDDDRPDRTVEEAAVIVEPNRVPPRAKLLKAFLYFGGSLYLDGDEVETPDTQVELQGPGATDFVPVEGEQVYRSGAIRGFPEVSLYSVRADVTEILRDGPITGTYRVRGFASDIFNGDAEHTAANASFSIILIFEEARLPPRNIVLFDGMQEVLGSTVTLDISGFIVSEQPSGSLTLYALEGDCNPGPDACDNGENLAGLERVEVIGADGVRRMVLEDALNPPNDIFNRTINTVQPPLQNVTGTDIDTFDITPVLRAGDEAVTVTVTTPEAANNQAGELVGLGYVIVGIDVFAPEFRVDSRIEVETERGSELDAYFPGDPLRVTYALSNTGNLPGSEVSLSTDLPEDVTRFVVLQEPVGATVTVDPTGGANARGRVEVDGLSVRHGEVDDLVLLVETDCPRTNPGELTLTANVGKAKEGGLPFTMTTTVTLLARDICGPRFFLYGGGGCQGTNSMSPPWASFVILLVGLGFWRRKSLLGILLGTIALLSCSPNELGNVGPDSPPPVPLGFACPDRPGMVVIPSIRQQAPFCIDQYEASIREGALGNAVQPDGGDESTTAIAESVRFALPAHGVSWHQANAACANAGKRLCTAKEWQVACRGDSEFSYPYGDLHQPGVCNGFAATRGGVVETGAMIEPRPREDAFYDAAGCVSTHGAYDLSGNVWEWNADPFLSGSRRGLAGGSFRSNSAGLACVTEDNHAEPEEADESYGFRCCDDY